MKRARKITARLSAVTAQFAAAEGECTVKAAEGESKGPPTYSGVLYSGGIIPRHTLRGIKLDADYVIDLAGMKEGRGVKANLDHDRKQRVGHNEKFDNDGKRLYVEGVLSAETPYRDQVAKSAANRYGWQISLEADLTKPNKLAAGKKATVNGREFAGPLYIFPQSVLTDIGFVDRGADAGNSVTIAAADAAREEPMNELEKFAASLGLDYATATDAAKARLQSMHTAWLASEAGKGPEKTLAQLAEEQRQDNERKSQIRQISVQAMKDHPFFIEQIKALGELAEQNGSTPDQYELELIRATRSKAGQFTAQARGSAYDPKVVECALALNSGLSDLEKHYDERTLEAVDRSGMRNNFGIQRLLFQVACANGYHAVPGERISTTNIRSILEHCFPGVHARLSGFSTVSLPGILGNVANKHILAGYMEEDRTWEEIADVSPVSNFYQHTHYRMLDSLEYEEVGPGGELKHGTLGQESFTTQVKSYGKMLGLSMQQIINDDQGAFSDMRTRLGRGGAKAFNNTFWAVFMDNSTFFTTARTNYIEGATTNLGSDGVGLQLGITAYRSMLSPAADGLKRMGVAAGRPTKILVPPALEFVARRFHQSLNLVGGSSSIPDANIFAGLYRPVIQDRLSDAAYTGNSTTAWYLFGDNLKPMRVTFLNGNRTPTVESAEADFNTLGIQFRGHHHFGCDKSEYLAGIKSKGAA
jgi:hypothetical protein